MDSGGISMNREFEFRQLLRAYRSGIIDEAAFEEEMAKLEGVADAQPETGFKAFGRVYKSEREAIVSFLDKAVAAEANGGEAFAAWASVCKTDSMRTGLGMIAEREAYHARIFEQRLLELGAERRASPSEAASELKEYLGDPNVADNEKLSRFISIVGEPEEATRPIHEFIALIKDDAETREALRLFAQDELSSTTWLWDWCSALNQPAPQPAEETKTAGGTSNRG
jgi:rubrerythrin